MGKTPPEPGHNIKHTLLAVLRYGIVALAITLVIVAIPIFYSRQHMVLVAGISVNLNKSGETVFTRVVSDTPAAQAGILISDVLVAMNGQPLPNGSPAYAIYDKLNGWINTPITLTVRTGDAVPRAAAVTRTPDPNSVAARLSALDVSLEFIVDFMLFVDIAVLAVYLVVAMVLILRGQHTPLLYFASIALVTFGVSATNSVQWLAREQTAWGELASIFIAAGFAAAFTFLGFLYPDGKWTPRRGRILAAIIWVWTALQWVWPAARPANWDPIISFVVYLAMIIAMYVAQTHRYRRIATTEQRQQIKWFVTALASVVAGYAISQIAGIIIYILGFVLTRASSVVVLFVWLISVLGYEIPYALLAVAIGMALLRHRLWDIDVVINQSLVYSMLTASLAILFAVVLAIANALIGQFFGAASPLLVAAVTTAFPVAMFNPLRARIQKLVDGRLKPEEVSYSEISQLLVLEVQALLPASELFETLAGAVAGQLDLTFAAAYTHTPDNRLVLAHTTSTEGGDPAELAIDDDMRDKMEHGELVTLPEGSRHTCYIPLTTIGVPVPRVRVCGVLALGPRKNEKGFTTAVENGLRTLGHEAGKSLYVALRRGNS